MSREEAIEILKACENEDSVKFALLSAMAELRFKCCSGDCVHCDDVVVCAEMVLYSDRR